MQKSAENTASSLVRWAERNKVITRPSVCESCGKRKPHIHAAHYNYERKNCLVVRWLCRSCHHIWDKDFPKPIPAPEVKLHRIVIRNRDGRSYNRVVYVPDPDNPPNSPYI